MATSGSSDKAANARSRERTNYARLCRAIVDLGTEVLRSVLTNEIPPGDILCKAQSCRSLKLNPLQTSILHTAIGQDYTQFDISLLYTLIRKLCPSVAPTHGWSHSAPPSPLEITEGDDVERIHYVRNNIYGHLSTACILDTQYIQYWQILQGVMARTDARFNTHLGQQLSQLETCHMTSNDIEKAVETIQSDVQCLQRQVHNLTELQRLGADNQVTTLSIIDGHRNDKTFLCTKAVTDGLKKLEDNGVLIYSGVAGSGKSTNSLEVAKQFLDLHPGHVVLSINDVTKWEAYVSPGEDTLVIFDDFLGSTNVNKHILQEGRNYWKQIYACVQSGRLKVIMTIRRHMLEESSSELETNKLFVKKNIIDLSSADYVLNRQEKREMFRLHGEMNKINIVYDWDEENFSLGEVLDEDTTATICRSRVERIIKSEPLMGFPQALFLFCSDRKYTRLGESFFLHPTQSLVKEINNLKESDKVHEKLQYCVLVYMLMWNKEIDIEKMDSEVWSNITKTFQLPKLPNDITMKTVVNSMTNKYITNVDKTYVYKFKHETILEAVAVSLGNSSVALLLKYCDMTFIFEFIRTKQYTVKDGEAIIMLKSKSEYECLVHRFIHDLMTSVNDRYRWISHPVVDDPDFVSCLMAIVQSSDVYVQAIREHCRKWWGIFYTACECDKYRFVDTLYTHYHKDIDTYLCLPAAGTATTMWLLDHQVDADNIVVALNTDTSKKLNVMLSHPTVLMTHLTQCIDTHGIPYNIDYNTINIILDRWPDIDMEYLVKLLFEKSPTEKLNVILPHPAVQLTHLSQYVDRHGVPCDANFSTVKYILDRWPDIEMKYVEKLLLHIFDHDRCTTEELNVILGHSAVQLTHLTQYLDTIGVPRRTSYSTFIVILQRWPDTDSKYIEQLFLHVLYYGEGTTEELNDILSHPAVQLIHLTQYINKYGVPDTTNCSTLKVILDRWSVVDIKCLEKLLLYVFQYEGGIQEEINIVLHHPAIQLTHLTHYIDKHGVPDNTKYSSVKVILDRWPDIDIKYAEKLLLFVFHYDRGSTDELNFMLNHPALQLTHLTEYINIYGVPDSADFSTFVVILDRWPDIDVKYVVKLLLHLFWYRRNTTEEMNAVLSHPAVQRTHLTQYIDIEGVPHKADYSTVKVIMDRWPDIDIRYVAKLLFDRGTTEKLKVILSHPAVQLSHLTTYIDTYDVPDGTDYSIVKTLLDRWPNIDINYVVKLLLHVFHNDSGSAEELNVMLSHPSVQLTQITQCIDRHGVPYGADYSTVKTVLDRWPDIDMKYVVKLLFYSSTTEKLNGTLINPAVQLSHLKQYMDRYGVPDNTEYSTVKILLDRWPNIDMQYIYKLLLNVFQYVDGTTEEINAILSHPAVQLRHLTRCIDRHGVPRHTDYNTVTNIFEKWPNIDTKYVEELMLHVFYYGEGTADELNVMLTHSAVQLTNLTKCLDTHGLPDNADCSTIKVILDRWSDIGMKYLEKLLLYVFQYDRGISEEINIVLSHPAIKQTHLMDYIDKHGVPYNTQYSTVKVIFDRWPDMAHVEMLLVHVLRYGRVTTDILNDMLCHPAVQLIYLTQYIDRHGVPKSVDHSTVILIFDRWPDIDMKFVKKLLFYVFKNDLCTTEQLNVLLSHPVVQPTHLTQYVDIEGVPKCTDYSTVKCIFDRWPAIDMKYVEELLFYAFRYDLGTTEKLNVLLSHPAVQMTHITQYLDRGCVPYATDYSTVKVILDRWPNIDRKYVESLVFHVFLRHKKSTTG